MYACSLVQVRAQLTGVSALLLPCVFWELCAGCQFGNQFLYLVSHLTSFIYRIHLLNNIRQVNLQQLIICTSHLLGHLERP